MKAILLLLVLIATTAGAQTNAPVSTRPFRNMGVDSRVNALAQKLSLTAEQKVKVKSLLEEQARQLQAAKETLAALDADERRKRMRALHSNTAAKLYDILTPEQFAAFQKLQAPRATNAPIVK